MNKFEDYQIKYKTTLFKLGTHSVVAIIALIAIGSATRVMEAGLACPDWPLCYGTFLPLNHMNLRVFLEWFHRLDAFLVGVLILTQFYLSFLWRKYLPNWLPRIYSFLIFLVVLQGSLGALTVINMLSSFTVMGHLVIAFCLLITFVSINQKLTNNNSENNNVWWKFLLTIPLLLTLIQSTIGARLSSTWSAHLCIDYSQQCMVLDTHKLFAIPVFFSIIAIISVSLFNFYIFLNNWKFLLSAVLLISLQILIGIFTLKTNLNQPLLIVTHQIVASLLISTLTTLIFKNSNSSSITNLTKKTILSFN